MKSLIGTFVNVWLHPWATMAALKEQADQGIKQSMIFVVVMGVISGLITAVVGMILPPPNVGGAIPTGITWLAVLVVPLVSFIGSFIGALILWGLIFGLLRGSAEEYKGTYRLLSLLAAFSPVSALLSPIPAAGPVIAILINLWATIVMIRGIIIAMDTPKVRTWVTCGIIFGLLFLLGITARFAAQQQLAAGLPGAAGDLGDLNLGDEQLNAELEALAEQARDEN